ncbi:hypothetical protein M9458_042766, partial [Cirrhinus mrigala]
RRSRSSPPASWLTKLCKPPPLTPPPLLPGEPSKSRSDWPENSNSAHATLTPPSAFLLT